jgi:hypothetical protein
MLLWRVLRKRLHLSTNYLSLNALYRCKALYNRANSSFCTFERWQYVSPKRQNIRTSRYRVQKDIYLKVMVFAGVTPCSTTESTRVPRYFRQPYYKNFAVPPLPSHPSASNPNNNIPPFPACPTHLIGQQAICIKASAINWNRSKLAACPLKWIRL